MWARDKGGPQSFSFSFYFMYLNFCFNLIRDAFVRKAATLEREVLVAVDLCRTGELALTFKLLEGQETDLSISYLYQQNNVIVNF